ncbi:N-acetylmuramoyl-L-alanine amidase [Paenibacillus sp. 1_12]|uniref:N-acetylmuramoyl-L-alanine amidase n=1 Tax=Paenibacillus sp. 1_12 TaxID=1566278 RepID=UPI000B87DEF0|nr:N-acetylmuramoyl-L-alanine amidase [Paenibacillus sp. 1_12]
MVSKTIRAAIICICVFNIGWQPSAKAQPVKNNAAIVQASSLNIRSSPDINSTVIGSLKRDTLVSVSQESYGWLKIQTGNTIGWVAGQYLKTNSQNQSNTSNMASSNVLQSGKSNTSSPKQTKVSVSQINNPIRSNPGLKGKVIVIDPGHGGNDHGGIGKMYGTSEKSLNLQTSSYLAEKLRFSGAEVILTRTDDKEKPELSKRVEISIAKRADAFVSIHYNASPKLVSGTLTFFYSESKDMPLARKIEAQLSGTFGLKSNGISYGDFHVLRENTRPSALIELGFLSNPKDEAIIRTSDYQLKAAEAIVDGLKDYFNG